MAHYGSFADLSSLDSDELVAQDAHAATLTHTHKAASPAEGHHRQHHGHTDNHNLEPHERGAYDWCDQNSDDQSEGDQGDEHNWWDEFKDNGAGSHAASYSHEGGAPAVPKRKQRHSDPGSYSLSMTSVVSKQERCNSLRRRILLRSTVEHARAR